MKTLLIVSGASRGLGQAIAVAVADFCIPKEPQKDDHHHLICVLLARSEHGLDATSQRLRHVETSSRKSNNNVILDVFSFVVDFSDLSSLEQDIASVEDVIPRPDYYDRSILINNAGSLGHLGPATNLTSLPSAQHTVDLNVTSCIWLSSYFVRTFCEKKLNNSAEERRSTTSFVVNISSLCAIKPFNTMAMYCAGKAARDMFHTVLANELSLDKERYGHVKILNYAPGACDTDMTTELSECAELDNDLSVYYNNAKREKKLIDPIDTSRRLVHLLERNDFLSGSHVDYWDVENKST